MRKVLLLARHCVADGVCSSVTVLFLVMLLAAVFAGEFVSKLGLIEQTALRLSVHAFVARILSVMVLAVQVSISFNEEWRNGQMQMVMSTEISRGQYLLSRAVGAVIYALVLSLVVGISLVWWTPGTALIVWLTGLFLEMVVVAMFALFVVVTFQSLSVAMLMSGAFYGLSRIIDPLLLMANTPDAGVIGDGMLFLGFLVPSLGKFNQVDWLIYGVSERVSLASIGFEAGLFVILLFTAALIDLYRREL